MDRRRQAYFQGMGYILKLRIKIKIHFKSDSFACVYIIWEKNHREYGMEAEKLEQFLILLHASTFYYFT